MSLINLFEAKKKSTSNGFQPIENPHATIFKELVSVAEQVAVTSGRLDKSAISSPGNLEISANGIQSEKPPRSLVRGLVTNPIVRIPGKIALGLLDGPMGTPDQNLQGSCCEQVLFESDGLRVTRRIQTESRKSRTSTSLVAFSLGKIGTMVSMESGEVEPEVFCQGEDQIYRAYRAGDRLDHFMSAVTQIRTCLDNSQNDSQK